MKNYLKDNAFRLGAVAIMAVLCVMGAFPDPAVAGLAMAAPLMIGETDVAGLKKLLEDQGKAWDEFKTSNDALIKAKAEGKAVADLEAKVATLSAELDKVGELKARVEEAIAKAQRPVEQEKTEAAVRVEAAFFNLTRKSNAGQRGMSYAGDVSVEEYKHYRDGFFKLARCGNPELLSSEERKAMTAGTDSEGGYLLPAATAGRVVNRVFELSDIRSISNVTQISAQALEGVADTDEAASGWVGETAARTETTAPTVGKYRIEAFEMYAAPKATQTLIDDAALDFEAWMIGKIADKLARTEGSAFCVGDGVAKPKGITKYTTAATADASRAWGQLEHVKTGANGAFHTTQADPLFDLIAAFKPGYLRNAKWVTLRSVIGAIRKFKTTTTLEYIWQPGLQAGQPDKLLGFPVVNCQDMPALATDSLSMALGDFNEAYQIVDRVGLRVLRDPYTSKPYVIFYSTKRTGGGVVNFDALKLIKFSA